MELFHLGGVGGGVRTRGDMIMSVGAREQSPLQTIHRNVDPVKTATAY